MKSQKISFYQILQINKTATQQQIKQSYKRLALKYHPDKNQDKESAKIKFRQIAEAYAVLNDPQKRKNYDKYGTADLEFDGLNFQEFMDDFGVFQEFLQEFLSFDDFQAMFSGMGKSKGKKNKKGRAKNRKKGKPSGLQAMLGNMGGNMQMALLEAMMQDNNMDMDELQQMMMGMDLDQAQKQLQKMILESDNSDQDQQDLTEQQLRILAFGEKNIQKKKVGSKKKKKKETRCKLCSNKIQQDQILMHFSEKHMEEFKKQDGERNSPSKKQQNKKNVQQQQFDY